MLYKKREEDAEIKKVKEKYPVLYKNINTKEKLDEFNKNFEQPINPFVEPTKTHDNFSSKSFNVSQSEDDTFEIVERYAEEVREGAIKVTKQVLKKLEDK